VATLQLTQDPAADSLLSEDPFALLTGMLLDQQVPMETAFAGPKKIWDRLQRVDTCQPCQTTTACDSSDPTLRPPRIFLA
jgi:uncharacterized HhH-GPD family protein